MGNPLLEDIPVKRVNPLLEDIPKERINPLLEDTDNYGIEPGTAQGRIKTVKELADPVLKAADFLRRLETSSIANALIDGKPIKEVFQEYIKGITSPTPEYRPGYKEIIQKLRNKLSGIQEPIKNANPLLDEGQYQVQPRIGTYQGKVLGSSETMDTLVGMILDIGLDPITYINPVGAISKVGKGIKVIRELSEAGKLVGGAEKLGAGLVKGAEIAGKVAKNYPGRQWVVNIFVGVDNAVLRGLIAKNRALADYYTGRWAERSNKWIAEKIKDLPADTGERITHALEAVKTNPNAIEELASISPKAVEAAKYAQRQNAVILGLEQKYGVGTKGLGTAAEKVVAEVSDPLISEARKYKTAEEFVNKQKVSYHGTDKSFNEFSKENVGENWWSDFGEGVYFTNNKEIAKTYGKNIKENYLDIKNPARNKDLLDADIQGAIDDGMGFKDVGEVLKEKGFDGIEYTHKDGNVEYVVFDTKQIKTKQELTDIWDKAQKAIEQPPTGGKFDYTTRIITPQVEKDLAKEARNSGLTKEQYSTKHQSQLERTTKDYSIEEINKAAKEGKLRDVGIETDKVYKDGYFVTDPAYILAVRGERNAKSISNAILQRDVAKLFGKATKEAPAEWKSITLQMAKGTESPFKGLKFEPVVANEISKHWNKINNPKEIGRFIEITDKITNFWKKTTLGIFPSYHFRNEIGNVWNNYLAGVTNPMVYEEAKRLTDLAKTGKLVGKDLQLYRQAEKYGVINKGLMAADIPTKDIALKQPLREKIFGKTLGHPLETGMKIGTEFENNARLAHFIDKGHKGLDFNQASMSVKKYLFDYQELTDIERNYLKRVFPFWTWSRRNIPLQIENLIKQPGKYAVIEKGRKAIGGGEAEPERKYLPAYMKEGYSFRIGKSNKNISTYQSLDSYLPAADILKLTNIPRLALGLAHPAKTLVELAMNYSTFYKQTIAKNDWERKELLGKYVPNKVDYILRTIRGINEMDKLFGAKSENLTPVEKALRFTTGIKLTKLDIRKARGFYINQLENERNTAKHQFKEARIKYTQTKNKIHLDEANRLAREIIKISKEMRQR